MSNLVNTNIPWLPYLKTDWKVLRVKNTFYASKEKAHQETPTILSLARSGVKIRDISNNEGQLAESYYDYNPVKPGDLLLNPMDLYSGANCNVSEVEGVISPAYANLRSKIKLEPKYFDFYFKTQYWTMAMFAHGKGVSFDNRWTLNNETLMNYELPFPPYEEQIRIVGLLKDKIAKIDELIQNQEKQIEKLKEYKQSFIKDFITMGLKENVKTKDSCINWIGQIPENWELIYFKYCHSGTNCGESIDKNFMTDDPNETIFYTAGLSTQYTVYKEFPKDKFTKKNDLLLSRNGNPYVFIPCENATYSDHVIRTNIRNVFNLNFIKLALQTSILFEKAEGVSIVTWSAPIWNRQILPLPPLNEQNQIVSYIEFNCDKVDALIKIKQEKIEKLQEYKKSLIYEYVTGKKEV